MFISLLLWSASLSSAAESTPDRTEVQSVSNRLNAAVIPLFQRIELDLDPANPGYEGRVQITLDVPPGQRLDSFRLHSEGLTVQRATLLRKNGRSRPREAEVSRVGNTQLQIVPAKRLRPGRYVLEMSYTGSLHEQPYGLYRFKHGDDWYVVTQLEADEARTAWPSFDEPAYKIPWQLSVRAPEALQMISNSPVSADAEEDGLRTVEFAWTPPMPSYAVALAVGPYVGLPVEGMSVPGTVWTTKGRESLAPSIAEELPQITGWLEEWFDSKYPYQKLDFVAVPLFAFGAMENPGCVVLHERLLYDEASATPRARRAVLSVGAHEVAHMWFGDLVTMAWWDDLWLNEAFATWMGHNTMHALAPEYRDEVARVARVAGMLGQDGMVTSRPLRTEVDPAAVFETSNFAVYPKGEALLDMTRAWIGPDRFRKGLGVYLKRHAWSNATHADLFAALEEVSDKPVGEMMSGYLDRPGAPLVSLALGADGVLRLEQRRFALRGEDVEDDRWLVPVRMRVGREGGTSEIVTVELRGDAETVELGTGVRWVHPAAEGLGYYAWTLDEPGWDALLASVSELAPAERRSVVEALGLQVASGGRELDDLLARMASFDDEADPAVVEAVVEAVVRVRVIESQAEPALEARMNRWIRARLEPQLERIGMDTDLSGAGASRLRQRLLERLAEAGHRKVLGHGRRIGRRFLDEPGADAFDLVPWGLAVMAQGGSPKLQERLFAAAEQTDDLRLGSALWYAAGLVPGDVARDRALARALADETPVQAVDALLRGVSDARPDDADQDMLLDWAMEHYEGLVAGRSPVHRMRFAAIGGGCDMARFQKSRAFFSSPDRAVPGTERVLAETERRVRRCIAERERHGPRVRAFLDAWRPR